MLRRKKKTKATITATAIHTMAAAVPRLNTKWVAFVVRPEKTPMNATMRATIADMILGNLIIL